MTGRTVMIGRAAAGRATMIGRVRRPETGGR
jgi:hypothetical protein